LHEKQALNGMSDGIWALATRRSCLFEGASANMWDFWALELTTSQVSKFCLQSARIACLPFEDIPAPFMTFGRMANLITSKIAFTQQ